MDPSSLVPRAREWVMAGAWLVLWLTATLWVIDAWRTEPDIALAYWIGGAAVALLVASGYLLARANRWPYLLALVPYVTFLVVIVYEVAMFLPTEAGPVNESAAAAGAVILGLAAGLVIAVMVALGAVPGWLLRIRKARE